MLKFRALNLSAPRGEDVVLALYGVSAGGIDYVKKPKRVGNSGNFRLVLIGRGAADDGLASARC